MREILMVVQWLKALKVVQRGENDVDGGAVVKDQPGEIRNKCANPQYAHAHRIPHTSRGR